MEDQETDFELDLENVLCQVARLAENYGKRKVSSKDFGYELEDLYEDTDSCLEEATRVFNKSTSQLEWAPRLLHSSTWSE